MKKKTLKKQKPIKAIQKKGFKEPVKNIYPTMGFKQGNYNGIMKYLVEIGGFRETSLCAYSL